MTAYRECEGSGFRMNNVQCCCVVRIVPFISLSRVRGPRVYTHFHTNHQLSMRIKLIIIHLATFSVSQPPCKHVQTRAPQHTKHSWPGAGAGEQRHSMRNPLQYNPGEHARLLSPGTRRPASSTFINALRPRASIRTRT